jgi:hypothetical protein
MDDDRWEWWIDLDGETAIRWRRIGGHRILADLRR